MSWRRPTGSIRREKWYTPQPQRLAEYGGAKESGSRIAGLVFLHLDTPTWHNVYDVFTETVCIMILRLSSGLNIPHPLTSILYISSL